MIASSARRVLIVDDEANVCSALRRSLSREGYQIEACTNPDEALAKMKTRSFDLVISDHLMPEMTGLEFLKRVRDRYPDAVRIILTGHADMQTAIDAINQGEIYRFLTKPWDDLELKVCITLAFEKLDLERENRALLSRLRALSDRLVREKPALGSLRRDETGAILLDA
ncbi:MAG: response regulator [Myxococcales bacterium]|nr:response regulator [Myxococcales bacterium]